VTAATSMEDRKGEEAKDALKREGGRWARNEGEGKGRVVGRWGEWQATLARLRRQRAAAEEGMEE